MSYKIVEKMAIDDKLIDLTGYVKRDDIINIIAPVGHTMIRLDNKNPASLPGYESTTWELISQGRAIIGANTAYPLGSEGGSPDAVVVTHTHPQNPHTHPQNPHTHPQNPHTHPQNPHTHPQNAHSHESNGREYLMCAAGGDVTADVSRRNAPASDVGRYYLYVDKPASQGGGIGEANNITATATNQNATAVNQNATAVNQNATAVNQNATATNQNAGESGTGKNMMPYKAFNIWIRTA